jgi:hypothetical protein
MFCCCIYSLLFDAAVYIIWWKFILLGKEIVLHFDMYNVAI